MSLTNGQWRIRSWFPDLDERAQERLRIYQLELLRWTKTINLISPSSAPSADLVHFADSILGARLVLNDLSGSSEKHEIWDIGSGNGFPGVVFAILRPEQGVICVESDERKASFLKQLGIRLELDVLGVRRERFENLPAESIQVAVARGFAPVGTALSQGSRAFVSGGYMYHFKGPDWMREVKEIKGSVSAGWNTSCLAEYELDLEKIDQEKKPWPKRAIIKSVRK